MYMSVALRVFLKIVIPIGTAPDTREPCLKGSRESKKITVYATLDSGATKERKGAPDSGS